MPPSAKAQKGQDKALEKQKLKVAEDKTFGLKNKNKSKAVQKYIKSVQDTATGKANISEEKRLKDEYEKKEEKKKTAQQRALLAALSKGTENIKILAESSTTKKFDAKATKEEQKIDLYKDPRTNKNYEDWADELDTNETRIICKHFLDAVESRKYGWFWICPNGGNSCKYRHCLPIGYVLNIREEEDDAAGYNSDEEEPLEEILERERAALPPGGTAVTLETFLAWKKRKAEEKQQKLQEAKIAAAAKIGKSDIMSGRALFTFDPTLFVDDDMAEELESREEDLSGSDDDDDDDDDDADDGSRKNSQQQRNDGNSIVDEEEEDDDTTNNSVNAAKRTSSIEIDNKNIQIQKPDLFLGDDDLPDEL